MQQEQQISECTDTQNHPWQHVQAGAAARLHILGHDVLKRNQIGRLRRCLIERRSIFRDPHIQINIMQIEDLQRLGHS